MESGKSRSKSDQAQECLEAAEGLWDNLSGPGRLNVLVGSVGNVHYPKQCGVLAAKQDSKHLKIWSSICLLAVV